MTSAEQLRRLLALLPGLADGNEHSIADVAARLDVDARTLLKDLHDFSDRAGDPPGWIDRVQLFIDAEQVSMGPASHFRRPMALTQEEWRALELGLALLRAERPPDERQPLERALEKVRDIMTEAPPDDVIHAATLGGERHSSALAALRKAISERKRVTITYQKGASDEADRRTVCPYSLVTDHGVWYVVAHCDRSAGIRFFRLDRVLSLELLDQTFERSEEVDVDAMLASGRAFVGDPPERLRVRYSPRVARWIAEREKGTSLPDGSIEVEYPMADPSWAMRHVLQYGPEAVVISPAEVREEIVRRLEALHE
jgi:predicted DNA-binding transcriptional regulator YafY